LLRICHIRCVLLFCVHFMGHSADVLNISSYAIRAFIRVF
jgi:hypothetical protein